MEAELSPVLIIKESRGIRGCGSSKCNQYLVNYRARLRQKDIHISGRGWRLLAMPEWWFVCPIIHNYGQVEC